MLRHKCSECSGPLPSTWRPTATRTCQPVCPDCAVKHMKTKSIRRRALQELREKNAATSVQPVKS